MVMKRLICLVFVLHLFQWPHSQASERILVVHSYDKGYDWTQEITKAITAELEPRDVAYTFFYMDTKRNPGPALIKRAALEAKNVIRDFKPKVVIAVDDNAQAYLVKDYVNQSPIQFVFCGVNAKPEKYGYPADNVTGILERTYPAQTLRMLKTLLPNVHRVAVITDHSPTAKLVLWHIQQRNLNSNPGVSITEYLQPVTFSRWQETILRLDQDPRVDAMMIPLFHTVRQDSDQTSEDSNDVIAWTLAHTQKPVVGLYPQIVNRGGFLAVTVDPHEHGRVAAKMALEIVKGKKAADIPMRYNKDGYVMVNLKDKAHLPFDFKVDIDQIADLVIR